MIRSFTEQHGLPLDVDVDGYLFLVRDEASWPGYRAAAAMQRRLGPDRGWTRRSWELVPGCDDGSSVTPGRRRIADPSTNEQLCGRPAGGARSTWHGGHVVRTDRWRPRGGLDAGR
jgi:hypothetical protein